jgi:hypothetical protein
MSETTVAERIAAAKARLDMPRPEPFKFDNEGDEIAGVMVYADKRDTAYRADVPNLVLDPGDGKLRSVLQFHAALRSQVEREDPQPGDVVAIRYLGLQVSESSGREYHAYNVTVERDPDREAPARDDAPYEDDEPPY